MQLPGQSVERGRETYEQRYRTIFKLLRTLIIVLKQSQILILSKIKFLLSLVIKTFSAEV